MARQHQQIAVVIEGVVVVQLIVARAPDVYHLADGVNLGHLGSRDAHDHAAVAWEQQAMAAVADNRHLAADLAVVVVEVHKVELGRVVAQDGKEAIGKRRVGLPRRDGEAFFLLALESRGLNRERRGSAGAVLCGTGEGYRVFVVGNEADDLELVLRCRRVAAVGRTGKGGDFGRVTGLFATGDLVGDGYGIYRCKADVAAQGVGAKGVLCDKRGSFVVAACSILSIEPLLDGRLFLDVIVATICLCSFFCSSVSSLLAVDASFALTPKAEQPMSSVPASASAPAAPARAARRENSLPSLSRNFKSLPSLNATVVSFICGDTCPALSNIARSLANAP